MSTEFNALCAKFGSNGATRITALVDEAANLNCDELQEAIAIMKKMVNDIDNAKWSEEHPI